MKELAPLTEAAADYVRAAVDSLDGGGRNALAAAINSNPDGVQFLVVLRIGGDTPLHVEVALQNGDVVSPIHAVQGEPVAIQ